jgi:hypothetical protein
MFLVPYLVDSAFTVSAWGRKDGAAAADIAAVKQALLSMHGKIEVIKAISLGDNVNDENLNRGFQTGMNVRVGVDMRFDLSLRYLRLSQVILTGPEALHVYLEHPVHVAVVKQMDSVLDHVCVVDYIA